VEVLSNWLRDHLARPDTLERAILIDHIDELLSDLAARGAVLIRRAPYEVSSILMKQEKRLYDPGIEITLPRGSKVDEPTLHALDQLGFYYQRPNGEHDWFINAESARIWPKKPRR
jgi:hypothetical protein